MSEGAGHFLFSEMQLPPELVDLLRRMNPWWEGRPGRALPTTKRALVGRIRRALARQLAPFVVVRGPRQIGKTVAQLHVIEEMIDEGFEPRRILRVQFDELPSFGDLKHPILALVDWYERTVLQASVNEAARSGPPVCLFFDEVQNLRDWAPQLKTLVDASTVQGVATGSSALRIELGRDSLAGRITTIEAGTLSLTEIGRFRGIDMPEPPIRDNGIDALGRKDFWTDLREHGIRHRDARDRAFEAFSERGGYPIAHHSPEAPWNSVADQLNENVVRRVIQHDLRIGERGRKRDPALLEELFRLACRYAGQAPGYSLLAREANRALAANVGPQRVQAYMRFLSESLLIRLIQPLEIRLKKKRGNAKISLVDHALRASWLHEFIPLSPQALASEPALGDLAGRIAESACGAILSAVGDLDLNHFPERSSEPEIDFVLSMGERRVPIEMKYRRRLQPMADTEAMRTFLEKAAYNAPFGVIVTQADDIQLDDPRIVALPLSSLAMMA